MDPGREALRKAIEATETWNPDVNDDFIRDAKSWRSVVEAAKRDLARLEGEKPKRATIDEMLTALSNHNGCIASLKHEAQALREAAAVLRAVGEFRDAWTTWRMNSGYITGQGAIDKTEEFLRSLP